MSIAYLPQDPAVQAKALKVQTLVCQTTDQFVTVSGSLFTVNVGESLSSVINANFYDDSAATSAPIVAANRSVSGTSVALTLSAAPAAADSVVISYVVAEA